MTSKALPEGKQNCTKLSYVPRTMPMVPEPLLVLETPLNEQDGGLKCYY